MPCLCLDHLSDSLSDSAQPTTPPGTPCANSLTHSCTPQPFMSGYGVMLLLPALVLSVQHGLAPGITVAGEQKAVTRR